MILMNTAFCILELFSLFYLLFHLSTLRFNKCISIIILISFSILNSLISLTVFNTFATILLIFNFFILTFLLFRSNYTILFIHTVIFCLIAGFISILSINLISIFTDYTSVELLNNSTIFLFGGLFNKLTLLFICIAYVKYKILINSNFKLNLLLFLILSLLVFLCIYLQFSLVIRINHIYTQLLTISMTLLLIIIFVIILIITINHSKVEEEKRKLESTNSLNIVFKEYKKEIEDNMNYLRTIKHDYTNHFNTLTDLIKEGHIDESLKLLSGLNNQVSSLNKNIWCSNFILNSLINNHVNNTPNVNFDIHISTNLSMLNELDTSILFANLLDNATTAANESTKKIINIQIAENEFFYIIEIENSILSNNINLNKSSKKDFVNHGYGLKNINNIIIKYSGNGSITISNFLFAYRILLPKEELKNV